MRLSRFATLLFLLTMVAACATTSTKKIVSPGEGETIVELIPPDAPVTVQKDPACEADTPPQWWAVERFTPQGLVVKTKWGVEAPVEISTEDAGAIYERIQRTGYTFIFPDKVYQATQAAVCMVQFARNGQ